MKTAELKLKIFEKIDRLDPAQLKEVYGLLSNVINSKLEPSDWEILSKKQKDGIFEAMKEMDEGMGIANEDVMKKYRKK